MADTLHVVVDSIGRPINVEPSEWDALKASIATGMQAVVGEVTKVTGEIKAAAALNKTQELLTAFTEFQKETTKNAQEDNKLLTEISNHLNTLNSQFGGEMAELRRLMQEVANNTKLGTGTGGGGAAATPVASMDMSGLMAGVQQMNVTLGMIKAGISGIGGFMATMTPAVGRVESAVSEIRRMGGTGWHSSDSATHKLLGEIKTAIENCCPGGTAASSGGSAASASSSAPAAAPTPAPAKTPPDPTGGGGRPSIAERMKMVTEAFAQNKAATEKAGEANKNHRRSLLEAEAAAARAERQHYAYINMLSSLTGHLHVAQQALLGFSKEMDLFGGVTRGVVSEEVKFIKDTRALAYEINGVTGETRGLQDAFTDIGKTVAATGFNRSDFQKSYLDNVKKGIKSQKDALAVTTAQLNTEKQLGLEAGSLGDEFTKWKTAYNMTNMQVAEMGRGMRDVARYTGLTGQNLANAVKTADQFILTMRNAATLTSAAAKNIMEISANAQKLGVSEQIGPLMKAMASTTNLFREASSETRAFLFQAAAQVGRTGDLMAGTVLKTKGGIKDMEKGMEMMLKKFGVESLEAIDQMSDGAKMKLNLQLKAAYGLELGELQNSLKALKESSKTLGDRLDEIRKKQQQNLTMEEKIALAEEARRLKTSKSFEMLTALDEAAKGAKDMGAALAQFGKRKGEFEGDLKAMGKSWGSNAQAAKAAIDQALAGVNESLKKSGKSELKIDSSEIEKALKDPAAFRELSAKLSKAEQEAATAQKAALDPMSKIEQGVNEINETLRRMSSGMLSGFMNLTGVAGLLVPALGLMAAEQAIGFEKMRVGFLKVIKPDPTTGEYGMVGGLLEKVGLVKPAPGAPGAGSPGTPGTPPAPGAGGLPGVPAAPANPADALKGGIPGTTHTKDDGVAGMLKEIAQILRDGVQGNLGKIFSTLSAIEKCICATDPLETKLKKQELKDRPKDVKAAGAQIQQGKDAAKEAEKSGGAAAEKEKGGGGTIPGGSEEGLVKQLDDLKGLGAKIAKGAAILAAVAVGLVILGIVIMKLCQVLLGALHMDMKTVMETAGMIAIIVGAGAALALAVGMAKKPLEEMGAELDEDSLKNMLLGAAFFAVAGPALVILSMAMLKLVNLFAGFMGMDWSVALQIAADMAAIIGAAAALAVAVKAAVEPLTEIGAMAQDVGLLQNMAIGAAALLVLTPLLTGLAIAILKITGAIAAYSGFDWKTALTTAGTVAALIGGAGIIAVAVLGAAYGLFLLGSMAETIFAASYQIAMGALALVVFAPLMVLLGAAIMKISSAIINGFGISVGEIIKTASAVTALAVAVPIIAVAMIVLVIALAALGAMASVIWQAYGLILMGVLAFGLLMGPLIAMGLAIAALGAVFDGLGLSIGHIAEIAVTAYALAIGATLLAAAMIALSIGLMALGAMAGIIWSAQGLIWMGVLAFLILQAPLVALAISLAALGKVFSMLGTSAQQMFEIVGTAVVLGAGAAALSYGLMYLSIGLAALGVITSSVILPAQSLIWMGVLGFIILAAPLAALGIAMAGLGLVFDKFGITAGRILEISATMLVLSLAIAVLAVTMALAMVGLGVLAVLGAIAWNFYGLLWMGVLGFTIIAAPMLALGAAIALFGYILIDQLGLTPGRMFEIAATMLILTIAIAALAVTMVVATALLGVLAVFGAVAWAFMGIIWLGVAGFIVLAAPILALGAAIAGFGYILIDELGLTPGRIFEISATMIILTLAIAALAVTMVIATALLGVLAVFGAVAWLFMGVIWLGVAGFLILAAPIMALGAAIAGFGEAFDEMGLTPSRIWDITKTMMILTVAIAALAVTFILANAMLAILGVVAIIAWLLSGLIWAGVAGFLMMAAPVMALGGAIAGFGQAFDEMGLTPERMMQIKDTFSTLTNMIASLSMTLISANAKLAILGILSIFASIGAYFADLGVEAFKTLAKPILSLAGTIASFGETLIDDLGLTSARMEEISSTFETLTETIGKLCSTMISTNRSLAWLGILSIFSGVMSYFTWLGVAAFRSLSRPIIALAESIAEFGDSIDIGALQNAARACEEVANTLKALPPVFDVLLNSLLPLTQGGWFWGSSPLTKIDKMIPIFSAAFWKISRFLWVGVVLPIMLYFGDPKDLEVAAQSAENMARVLTSLPPVFDALVNGILPLTKGGWFGRKSPIQKIQGMMWEFSSAFWNIARFLNQGIVQPIQAHFGDPQELATAGQAAEGMAKVISSVPPIIKSIVDELVPLMKPGLWGMAPSKMQKALTLASGDFRRNFQSILRFISQGIIDPIFGIGEGSEGIMVSPQDISMAAKIMQGLATMLPAIPPVIDALNGPIARLNSTGWSGKSKLEKVLDKLKVGFRANFQAILRFVSEGILDPIFGIGEGASGINLSPGDIQMAAKIMKGLADMLPAIPPVVEALNGPIARLNSTGWSGKSKLEKVLDKLTTGFRENFSAILRFVSEGIIDPIFGIGPGNEGINVSPRDIQYCATAMKGLADMLPAIPTVVETLNGPIGRLASPSLWGGGGSRIGDVLAKLGPEFKENLRGIFMFIGTGIIDPIFEANLNPRDIKFAADAMKNTAGLLPAVATFINRLGAQVQAILDSADMRMKMDAIQQFAQWFANVSSLLTDGMIIPIKTMFPPPEEVADMGNRLTGMNQLVAKLPQFMQELYGHMARGLALITSNAVHLGDVTEMTGWFSVVAMLLKQGIIDPLATWPPAEDIAKASAKVDQMAILMAKVPTFMSNLYSNIQAVLARINAGDIQQTEVTEFTRWFSAVAWLLDYGVIFPIKYLWPRENDIAAAITKVELMGNLMGKLAPMVQDMLSAINTIRAITAGGGDGWRTIGAFMWNTGFQVRSNLIDPLRYWPQESEIQQAIDQLTRLDELFRAMADAMQGVAAAAENMASVNVNAEIEGLNAPDTGFINAINEAYDDIMAKQAGAMEVGAFDPKILQDAGASATEQMTKNATSLQGTLSDLLSPAALKEVFAGTESNMQVAADTGGFSQMISSFVDSAHTQMGMGDTNALVDALSKQSPEITAMQSAIRQVENYTNDLKDLFERASHVITDIQKTTEYMSMFGDLDFYEKMIEQKVGASKQFVPTVQRIAEKIGKGFNFAGGKEMVATIASQSNKIEEMKAGLTATEAYTRRLSEIFAMASNTINQIRTTTSNLDALQSIREVEANIESRVASGNSFMTSIMKTVEAIATNFGSNEELTQSLTSVQDAIRRSGDVSQTMTEALQFIETVRQLQTSIMQVGQAAAQAGGQGAVAPSGATGTQTGGQQQQAGGNGQPNATNPGGTTGQAGGGAMEAVVMAMAQNVSIIKEQITIAADALRLMMTEATTRGSLYVADHAMVKTTEGTQETIVKGDNKIKEATLSTTEATTSALERGNTALTETISTGQQNMNASIENANTNLSNSISTTMATSQESLTQSISQANENLANSMTNLNVMLGSVLESLQVQNQSATTNANNAVTTGATNAAGGNTTTVGGATVRNRAIVGPTTVNNANQNLTANATSAVQPNQVVPQRRTPQLTQATTALNSQQVANTINANAAPTQAMTNINSQNLTGPAINNASASYNAAFQNAQTTSANEMAMNAASTVAPQSYSQSNLNAPSTAVNKVNLSSHQFQGISPAAVASDTIEERRWERRNNIINQGGMTNAVNNAVGGGVAGATVTNATNVVGGPQGIAGTGGLGDQSVISQALSSTTNTSRTRNTTLGGGVPGAGMPLSIPAAKVSLATPEPTQTAAHTAATTQNIQSQIMQERATSTAPAVAPGQAQDNSALQGIMQDGNLTAEGILSVLQAMYNMMKPKTGETGPGAGMTNNPITPKKPASFFRSPCGDLNSSAGKGATNMARIR